MNTTTIRAWGTIVFLGLGLSTGPILAQGSTPAGTEGQGKNQSKNQGKAAEAAAQRPGSEPQKLAKVLVEDLQPRCFASERSVRYEDKLAKGSTVEVVEEAGEFYRVRLPLGVVGYVSKGFSSAPDQAGLVSTTRPKVAFRYRPTPRGRAEAPVQTMDQGTELRFLADAGDWWKIRYASDSVYMKKDELQIFQAQQDTLTKAFADFGRRQEKEWQEASSTFAKAQAEAARRIQQRKTLEELAQRFREELGKPEAVTDFDKLRAEVDELAIAVPEADEELRGRVKILRDQIETRLNLIAAQKVLRAAPPPAEEIKVDLKTAPADPMARFADVGWLSIDESRIGIGRYRLMKGQRIISYINCRNLRYDLAMFEGVEVGVIGKKKLDAAVPYIEVEGLEVLGHAR